MKTLAALRVVALVLSANTALAVDWPVLDSERTMTVLWNKFHFDEEERFEVVNAETQQVRLVYHDLRNDKTATDRLIDPTAAPEGESKVWFQKINRHSDTCEENIYDTRSVESYITLSFDLSKTEVFHSVIEADCISPLYEGKTCKVYITKRKSMGEIHHVIKRYYFAEDNVLEAHTTGSSRDPEEMNPRIDHRYVLLDYAPTADPVLYEPGCSLL